MKTLSKNAILDHCTNFQKEVITEILGYPETGVVLLEKYDENNNIQTVRVFPTSLTVLQKYERRTIATLTEDHIDTKLPQLDKVVISTVEGLASPNVFRAFVRFLQTVQGGPFESIISKMSSIGDYEKIELIAMRRGIADGGVASLPDNCPPIAAAYILNYFSEHEGCEPKIVRLKYRKEIRKGDPVDVVFDADGYIPTVANEDKIKGDIVSLLETLGSK